MINKNDVEPETKDKVESNNNVKPDTVDPDNIILQIDETDKVNETDEVNKADNADKAIYQK